MSSSCVTFQGKIDRGSHNTVTKYSQTCLVWPFKGRLTEGHTIQLQCTVKPVLCDLSRKDWQRVTQYSYKVQSNLSCVTFQGKIDRGSHITVTKYSQTCLVWPFKRRLTEGHTIQLQSTVKPLLCDLSPWKVTQDRFDYIVTVLCDPLSIFPWKVTQDRFDCTL
jgi:hypothetical protein